MRYDKFFTEYCEGLRAEGRYRVFIDLERLVGEDPFAWWNRPDGAKQRVVVWCSNDYLGMSHHPDVVQAMLASVKTYGAGSGGTRNISGTAHEHVLLERTVANWHGKESGLIFTSGYNANEATLSTLGRELPNCVIFSDEKNHASVIQGIRASGAEKRIFKHNDAVHLKSLLAEYPLQQPKLVVFTSVYSMSGHFANIEAIVDAAANHNALTYLDEVHAVGLYGPEGAGLASALNLSDRIDIIQGNFAKAIGVVGGYIAASKALVDFIRSAASGFIFTTSLPPGVAAAARHSIQTLCNANDLRMRLMERVRLLKTLLAKSPVIFGDSPSHIVPIIVGDAEHCRQLANILLQDHNLYVQPINYPTVPRGQECLRLTLTPHHTEAMIHDFVKCLSEVWRRLDLAKAA